MCKLYAQVKREALGKKRREQRKYTCGPSVADIANLAPEAPFRPGLVRNVGTLERYVILCVETHAMDEHGFRRPGAEDDMGFMNPTAMLMLAITSAVVTSCLIILLAIF
jgi:hypothetical protein